jgi:CheY-like chemotaxis protein
VKARVLVVEDEAIAAMALRLMLETRDCSVVGVVGRGQEAIDLACAEHPDVVLMDIRLKGAMTGVEAARAIQARLAIPVIFTTAYSADELRTHCAVEGHHLYLSKPISEEQLANALATVLGRGSGPHA